jgi:phosphohistidine phosphatase
MRLYVIRHGHAASIGGGIVRDADRVLSATGEEEARRAGRMLAVMDPMLRLVITSPLRRAQQTAELICAALGGAGSPRTSEHLSPGFHHHAALEELAEAADGGSIAAVGHQPDLGMFLSYLLGSETALPFAVGTGAVACLTVPPGTPDAEVRLEWILTQDLLAKLTTT